MNTYKIEETNKNTINIDDKKYNPMDLNQISNIISQKVNCIKTIDDALIEELCNGLKLYCQEHNKMIGDWFDENFLNDLETLKSNSKNFMKLTSIFSSTSFISINDVN